MDELEMQYRYYECVIRLHEIEWEQHICEMRCRPNRYNEEEIETVIKIWNDYLEEKRGNGENYIKGEYGWFAGSKPAGGGNSSAKSVDKSQNGGIIKTESNNEDLATEKEIEYGVKYAENAVNADMDYINSDEFAEKFRDITPNENVNRTLLECSREAIDHRSGTLYEDMYLINAITGKVEGSQLDARRPQCIDYNDSLNDAIKRAEEENFPLIALHTHPEGFPPSIDDFNSLYDHGYVLGVVAGHNGQVYTFNRPNETIEDAKVIHNNIAFRYQGGVDVDRAYREIYKEYNIDYKIIGGNIYEKT